MGVQSEGTTEPISSKEPSKVSALLKQYGRDLLPIVLALVGGFVIGGIIIFFSGENPFQAYYALVYGAVGDSYNLAATLGRSMPIIGTGIAAALAFKAGLFNIGEEGQFVLGALAATVVALYFPPGPAALVIALLSSLLAGGVWSLLSGWFQTRFNVPILISSLLMNYIAVNFTSYMISFPLIEVGGARNQTPMFPEATRFGRLIPGTSVHWGIFIIIGIVILVGWVMAKTVPGFNLRMFGANREFAVSNGVNPIKTTLLTMLASGMIAGIAGANQVLGVHYRFIDTSLTLPGYAWSGVMAAILSNNNPVGVVLAGLFFSALQTGALGMERATEVPSQLSDIVQALMIVFIAVRAIMIIVPKARET
jgi:ABC-type uncharacterized transport system permease subunit